MMKLNARRSSRGFTLIEAMVALGISSIVILSAMSTFRIGITRQTDQGNSWMAYTLAQKWIEILSAFDATSSMLQDTVDDAVTPAEFGSTADATCATGADWLLYRNREGVNTGTVADKYVVCGKIADDDPNNMKIVRVVAGYNADGTTVTDLTTPNYIILQVMREGGL